MTSNNIKKESITFIIPVYNIPNNVLIQCFSSFLDQELSNKIQMIVINDNSPIEDNHKICLEYQKKYKNFSYIKLNKNLGVSAARYIGLFHTETEFCCFFDSDDFILKDKLKILIDVVSNESEKYDIWKSKERFVSDESLETKWISNNEYLKYSFDRGGSFGFYKNNMIGGKILRTSIAKDISMFYQKVQNYEDYFFVMCYLSKIQPERIGQINDEIFGISIRQNSASRVVSFYQKISAFLYYMNLFLRFKIDINDSDFYLKNKISKFQKFQMEKIFQNSFHDLVLNLFKTKYDCERKNVKNFYKLIKIKVKNDFQIELPKQTKKAVFYFKINRNKFFIILKVIYKKIKKRIS